MRSLICSIIMLAITCCCLLTACSDRDNPAGYTSQATFWRTYDLGDYEYFGSLTQSSGGSIIIGGQAELEFIDSSGPSPVIDTNHDASLVKCLSNGDTVWTTFFGSDRYVESVVALKPVPSGGYLAAIRRSYYGGPGADFDVLPLGDDGVLGPGMHVNQDQYDDVYDISGCSDGGFVLAGRQDNMGSRSAAYVVKVDARANMIWQETFGYANVNLRSQRIIELPDSTLLAAGIFNPADGSGVDLHILRLSAAGDSLYAVVVPIEGYVNVKDIATTSGGGYKVLLFQEHGLGACAVVRMDNYGTVTSIQYSYRSSPFVIEDGEFTSDGGAILCGRFETDLGDYAGLLIKLDASGTIAWEREFEDPDASIYFRAVIAYSGGGYIMAGSKRRLLDDSYESLLVRTNDNGGVLGAP